MFSKIVKKAQELILWAEGTMRDKTGPERKKAVVAALSEAIDIPFVPEWIEGLFEPLLYGFVVDAAVKWWNALTGHRIEEIELTPEIAAKTETAVRAEIKGTAAERLPDVVPGADPKTGESLTADRKFDALLEKYAVARG